MENEEVNPLEALKVQLKKDGLDFYSDPRKEREILPSGFLSLDSMLNGGLRAGTYVELFGEEATGKTYLALHWMRQCQQVWNKPVLYVDFEKSWYPDRAEEIGVDLHPDKCMVISPPSQEQGYDFIKRVLQSKAFGLIVIDSMSAMAPMKETEDEMSQANVALNARNNSKALRVLTALMGDATVIFINQMRTNIGVMFGDPNTTTGGKALKFYAGMRLKISKLAREKEEKMVYSSKKGDFDKVKVAPGHIMKISFDKSRMGNEHQICELVYDYNLKGVDQTEDIKAYLFTKGKLKKEGMWYLLEGEEKKIKGKKALNEYIKENPELIGELIKE
jgi:recombination protein RecA